MLSADADPELVRFRSADTVSPLANLFLVATTFVLAFSIKCISKCSRGVDGAFGENVIHSSRIICF